MSRNATVFYCTIYLCTGAYAVELEDDKARSDEAMRLARDEAAKYQVLRGEEFDELRLWPNPILRWSNPVSGQLYGWAFVWTHRGRPEAIASIYKWYSPHRHMGIEFHSLATAGLVTRRGGKQSGSRNLPVCA